MQYLAKVGWLLLLLLTFALLYLMPDSVNRLCNSLNDTSESNGLQND